MNRPLCSIEGCSRVARKLSKFTRKNGISYERKVKFSPFCDTHLKHRRFSTESCFVCGWDKANCDRHRLNGNNHKSKINGYRRLNVVSLCPNCHRLVHRGKLKIAIMVTESIENSASVRCPVDSAMEIQNG